MYFTIIGITDSAHQRLDTAATEAIERGRVFCGGKRHHELVKHLLPDNYQWIDVTVPLSKTFDALRACKDSMLRMDTEEPTATGVQDTSTESVVIFASGDPLFYGFAATLLREFPDAEMKVHPTFNSLQTLAHRLLLPYGEMVSVSATGRPWRGLDTELMRGTRTIGVLTDTHKTPHAIAQRLLEYGYDNYIMHIGQNLGNPDTELVATYPLHDVPTGVSRLNCVILQQTAPRHLPFGIPDNAFALLDGRAKMITKMPIRLATLATLDLSNRQCLWDIGFCTGSVSIEARLRFPHLDIEAFEIRPECEDIMRENCRRFGALGIGCHIGDFLTAQLDSLPRPDAVFVGGHGGHLAEIVERVRQYLLPGGAIVMNSVSQSSHDAFCDAVGAVEEHRIVLDEHNPIIIMKSEVRGCGCTTT